MRASQLRWLVFALLLANGVYFYWQNLRDTSVADIIDTSGEELVLLSEVISAPVVAQVEEEPAAPRVPVAPSRWFGGGVTTQLEEIEIPESVKRLEIDSELAAAYAKSPARIADAALPEVSAPDQAEPQALAQPEPATATQREPVSTPEPEPEPEVVAIPKTRQCWRAGPLEESSRPLLAAVYREKGLEMRLLPRKVVTETKYWVYVETANNPDIRKQTRAALLDAGIDNYVIAAGALAGDLSLGLFRQQNRAESIAAQRRQQGFLAKVYPVEKVEEKNWLLLDSEEASILGWPAEPEHVPGEPELRLKPMKCEEKPKAELQGRREMYRMPASSQLAFSTAWLQSWRG